MSSEIEDCSPGILDPRLSLYNLNVRLVELRDDIVVLALETLKVTLIRADVSSLGLHDGFVSTEGLSLLR